MTKKESDIIESLIVGGVIGASLGALLSKKGAGAVVGGIAGAAILASTKAYENAKKTEIPLIVEEDNALYKIYADGTKEFIKHIPPASQKLPKKFTLK
jgi:outer membrane lipoprotein SlyB